MVRAFASPTSRLRGRREEQSALHQEALCAHSYTLHTHGWPLKQAHVHTQVYTDKHRERQSDGRTNRQIDKIIQARAHTR